MDEPYFRSATSSDDQPSTPVRSESVAAGRALGTTLQNSFVEAQLVSHELDDVVHAVHSAGSDVDRIASDLGMSLDLIDYILRGGTSWTWFLNRGLYSNGSEPSPNHPA